VEVTVKKLRKPAIVYKNRLLFTKLVTGGPQNSRCGKCCQVLATTTLSRGFVLSQSTFHLVMLLLFYCAQVSLDAKVRDVINPFTQGSEGQRSRSRVTKSIAGVGLCTLVSAGLF